MKAKNSIKRKRKLKISLMRYNGRGSTSTGNSFVVAFIVLLVTLGVIFVGGVAPVATPPQTAPGKMSYNIKAPAKSQAQNSLQMYTFSGTAGKQIPGPTNAPTDVPCVPAAGGAAGGGAPGVNQTGPLCAPPGMGAKVLFAADYNSGSTAPWEQSAQCPPTTSVNIDPVGAREGAGSAHFIVNGGGPCFGDNSHRAEVVNYGGATLAHEGDERWYQFSVKFAPDFPMPNGVWMIFMQFHAGSGSPPVAFEVNNQGQVQITGKDVNEPNSIIGPIHKGVWTDYTLHVKWSNSHSGGFIEVYENCVLKVPKLVRATMRSGENYVKMGMYMDPSNGTKHFELWEDAVKITAP